MDKCVLENRITVDPHILVGKPVIRGMRISVAQIIAALAAGVHQEELLEEYPGLEPEDFQAALQIYPVKGSIDEIIPR